MAAQIAELAQLPFDLAGGPLIRAHLDRLYRRDEHILLLVLHHAIGDAWSSAILFRDLAESYNRACRRTRTCARRAAFPVRGLHRLAERLAAWGRARAPARLVAPSAARRPGTAGSCRPTGHARRGKATAAAAGAMDSTRRCWIVIDEFARASLGDPLHGAAVGLRRVAVAICRPAGPRHRLAGGRATARGAGRGHRLSSPTRSHCASNRRATRISSRCWARFVTPRWLPSITRTCRSRNWSKPCNRFGGSVTRRYSR